MKCQVNKSQAGIKIARRNISNLRYANNTTLMAESEELKNLFDTGEREWRKWKKSSKAGLKLKIQKIKIMTSSPNTSQQIDGGKVETVIDFIFLGSKITVDGDGSHEMRRCLLLGRKADKRRKHIKEQKHHFSDRGLYHQKYGFSSSHVWMWELDRKEDWMLNTWCFWTVVLEKTLERPLDSKEIKPVNPKGNQP